MGRRCYGGPQSREATRCCQTAIVRAQPCPRFFGLKFKNADFCSLVYFYFGPCRSSLCWYRAGRGSYRRILLVLRRAWCCALAAVLERAHGLPYALGLLTRGVVDMGELRKSVEAGCSSAEHTVSDSAVEVVQTAAKQLLLHRWCNRVEKFRGAGPHINGTPAASGGRNQGPID